MGYNEEQNELTHWGNDNGSHKYVDKKMVNGKWRYFYENGPSSLQTRVKNTMTPSKVAQRKAIRNAQYKKNVNKMFKNAKDRGAASSKAYDTNKAARKANVDKMFARAKEKGQVSSNAYDKLSAFEKTLSSLRLSGKSLINKGKKYASKLGDSASKTLSDLRTSGSKLLDRGSKFANSVINKAKSTSAYKKASNEMMWTKAKAKGKVNSAAYDIKKAAEPTVRKVKVNAQFAKAKAKGAVSDYKYEKSRTDVQKRVSKGGANKLQKERYERLTSDAAKKRRKKYAKEQNLKNNIYNLINNGYSN